MAVIGAAVSEREAFLQLLRALMAAQARVERMQEENRKLSARLEEARLVGRAKCALIRYRGLTEEEAHRCIEKEAMDTRLPKREVARTSCAPLRVRPVSGPENGRQKRIGIRGSRCACVFIYSVCNRSPNPKYTGNSPECVHIIPMLPIWRRKYASPL